MGTLQKYLDASLYRDRFDGLVPATSQFDKRWREIARTEDGFGQEQHDFIRLTHYDVQVSQLKSEGLDLAGRGPAVQDLLWSTAVQFGAQSSVIQRGIEEAFGLDCDLSKVSDRNIVEAVQDFKILHNNELFESSPKLWSGLLERASAEREALLQLTDLSASLVSPGQLHGGEVQLHKHQPEVRAEDVPTSIVNASGSQMTLTGGMGPGFLLTDSSHESFSLYRQVLSGVHQLDAAHHRSPDHHSDQLAAALVVEAKRAGLERIDEVVLGKEAERVFARQCGAHPALDRFAGVDTAVALNQSIASSTEKLEQVMHGLPSVPIEALQAAQCAERAQAHSL
jgi:hypothetical protein